MELVERYIFAVTKRLPEKQREDIEKELRGLIEDMLEEANDVEAVLLKLGDPAKLADKYRGKDRYLIGPEYFDKYLIILKIVLVTSAFAMLLSMVINYAVNPPNNVADVFSNFIESIFYALFQSFTWVTVIFALFEYNQVNLNKKSKKEFKPANLPEIPLPAARIKISGPIVGIIFSVIFMTILNFSPQLFAFKINGTDLIPAFNIDVLKSYMPLINLSFACIILKEILRIVYGRYNISLSIWTIILGGITLVLTVIVFTDYSLWNSNFISSLLQNAHIKIPAGFNSDNPMVSVANVFIAVSIFAYVVETVVTIAKTIKYHISKI